jgi:hypothetical protein
MTLTNRDSMGFRMLWREKPRKVLVDPEQQYLLGQQQLTILKEL